jgi:hypothetical protein
MEYALGLIKLKPGSDAKVEEWRRTIASRIEEAAATLQDEETQVESWFKVQIEGHDYLAWYLRAKSIQRVFDVSKQLNHPIDKYHYEIMSAITAADFLATPLIDFPRDKVP